jgi:hypothetical protein
VFLSVVIDDLLEDGSIENIVAEVFEIIISLILSFAFFFIDVLLSFTGPQRAAFRSRRCHHC